MLRYDIINRLIKYHGYKSYLEIGIHVGNCWQKIECEKKVGIDPDLRIVDTGLRKMTSDEYFESLDYQDEFVAFDIIFIDGLHLAEQVWKDTINSLKHLNPGGCIVYHDCNPPTLDHAGPEPRSFKKPLPSGEPHYVWCGTVWQAVSLFGLDFTVETDWGVGVWYPSDSLLQNRNLREWKDTPIFGWETFDIDRNQILNLISIDEFNERYPA